VTLQVERHASPEEFLERAESFLAPREAEHNLMFGLLSRLRRNPLAYGTAPYFATISTAGGVVAAAMRTPPYNLILSEVDDERACDAIAADAFDVYGSIRGVLGPVAPAARFVRTWEALTGAQGRFARGQRTYRAERAERPVGVPGSMRAYTEADRTLVLEWLEAFFDEAMGDEAVQTAEGTLKGKLEDPDGALVLWQDREPVSFAGYGGPTPNGIRIGPVYTPPELRRRGYATALTAELTAALLRDRRFCFLFTDLANPTSNSIYQKIGYEPVTDVDEWVFDQP